jgi:hypothetical protein
MRLLRSIGCVLAMVAAVPAWAQLHGGDAVAKASFALMLARFVQWPSTAFASASAPLRLCVLQASPAVAQAFMQRSGESVAGHPVVVVSNPAQPAECEVLFIDASAPRGLAALPPQNTPVLTIGSVDGFVSKGGMVELANVNDELRFDVNLKVLRQAQIQLSSQVLRLARQVRE